MADTRTIWFGTHPAEGGTMQFVKAPLAGLEMNQSGWAETGTLLSGRGFAATSRARHQEPLMEWSGSGGELDFIQDYYDGMYGQGRIYWCDPYAAPVNLFPANWASPNVIATGDWPQIYTSSTATSFVYTPTNGNGFPRVSAVYGVDTAVNTPTRTIFIPVPPGETLQLGYGGSVTGTGAVAYRTVSADGTYGTVTALTPLAVTSALRTNASVTGNVSTAVGVEVFVTRTTTATSSVTISGLMARIAPGAVNGPHTGGRGNTGYLFATPPGETYNYAASRKARSAQFVEVDYGWSDLFPVDPAGYGNGGYGQ